MIALHLRVIVMFAVAFVGLGRDMAASFAREPRTSGLNELVVLDPGVNARGLPGVVVQPSGDQLIIDIPPTVHVHRYYYAGDKEFQGPILQGGPTLVVANHPKTGQRMYIEVTLPSGSPIIAHSKSAITYVYPDRRISLRFSNWNPDKVHIKYHSGQGIGRRTAAVKEQVVSATRAHFQNSETFQSVKEHVHDSGGMMLGIRQSVDSAAATALDAVSSLTDVIPGVTALKGAGDDKPYRDYRASMEAARTRAERDAPTFLPTNR